MLQMDRVRSTLINALGEKAATDFIKFSLITLNVNDIKKRVCSLLDTRKAENRQVYEVLIRENKRQNAVDQEGYRKNKMDSNAPCHVMGDSNNGNRENKETESNPRLTSKTKRKPKFHPLFSEGAHDGQLVSLLPGRHPCQCLASKHQLINNCTYCGRIVCAQEGSGPCFYCGQLVCSKDEKRTIASGTKQALKLRNRLSQAVWASDIETPPYHFKCKKNATVKLPEVAVEHIRTDDDEEEEEEEEEDLRIFPSEDAQQRFERGLVAALANRDRLLEYDVTAASRTRVLDDEMDYFTSEGAGSGAAAWLTPEARERITKRVQELRAQRHASCLETRICLDFAGRSVQHVDLRAEAAEKLYRPNQQELEELDSIARCPQTQVGEAEDNRPTTDRDRLIDPSLGYQMLKFIHKPHDTHSLSERNASSENRLLAALRQTGCESRLQDDISRQLVDEGFCLSMHQPWASLVIRGIKKDEGRTWYSAHRGCLWIASTSKTPDPDDVKEMEEHYIRSGGTHSNLPTSYPTGCIVGRVTIVDVLSQEDYRVKYPLGESESP